MQVKLSDKMKNSTENLEDDFSNGEFAVDKLFWEKKWQNSETGWDIGYAAPAITEFMEQFSDKNSSILIPGCGNAYEAEFLLENGFTNVTLIDISKKAVENLQVKFKNNPHITIINGDFFGLKGQYDLIIEQTFFCAISPNLRRKYAEKSHELLTEKGQIVGLLFDTIFEKEGPPFGGNYLEYKAVFSPFFNINIMERCKNSIAPRQGSELFIKMIKNDTVFQ